MTDVEPDRRATLRERYIAATELPLLILAIAIIPLLVVPLIWELSDSVHDAFIAADWVIWAVFAADYLAGLCLAQSRRRYIRKEWAKLLIVALPFLRPLRVLRSARALRMLRLVRVAAFMSEGLLRVRRLLTRHGLHYVLLVVLVLVFGVAGLMTAIESGSEGSIDGYGDALWWAVTTVTTVGYGDAFPVSAAGRGLAVFLMIVGIAFFGVITANLAALLVSSEVDAPKDEASAKLDEVLVRLAELESQLTELRPAVKSPRRKAGP